MMTSLRFFKERFNNLSYTTITNTLSMAYNTLNYKPPTGRKLDKTSFLSGTKKVFSKWRIKHRYWASLSS